MGIIYIPIDTLTPNERLEKIIANSKANAIIKADLSIQKLNSDNNTIAEDALCVLYTSGSTGIPKGVVCSKSGVESFVKWGIKEFSITSKDRLTAYAPYHFDLSTFDIFASIGEGASVWLIDKNLGSNFRLLGEYNSKINPTVWYATPTVYKLLLQHGKLNDGFSPRVTLFAGEVFPISQLNELREKWKTSIYYNLYGPTETNVCTYHKLPKEIEYDRIEPYPIGTNCPYIESKLSNSGELLIMGKSVMLGYFYNEEETHKKLILEGGKKWLKTGDLVEEKNGVYQYKGRIDRMVKRSGYRIELGEIENILSQHSKITSVACVNITDKNELVKILAVYEGVLLSQIDLKMYCNEFLMQYMIPDKFIHTHQLPTNSNGKVDYIQLINTFNLNE